MQISYALINTIDLIVPHDPKERFPTFLQLTNYFLHRIMNAPPYDENTIQINCNGLIKAIEKGKKHQKHQKEEEHKPSLSKEYDQKQIAKWLIELFQAPTRMNKVGYRSKGKIIVANATQMVCTLIEYDAHYIQSFYDANLLTRVLVHQTYFDNICSIVKQIIRHGTEIQVLQLFSGGVMMPLLHSAIRYTELEWLPKVFVSVFFVFVAHASKAHLRHANDLGYVRWLIDNLSRLAKPPTRKVTTKADDVEDL